MLLSSFFFTFLNEFNQKEREKELFNKLELEAKNENLNKMTEKISEILDNNLPNLPKKMELKLPGMDKIKMPKKKEKKLKIVK